MASREAMGQELAARRRGTDLRTGLGHRREPRRGAIRRTNDGGGARLSRGLGWFGLGLGLTQLAVPGGLARAIGIRDDAGNRALLRAIGLREIASAAGILRGLHRRESLASRVAGDAMDLALLGRAFGSQGARRDRLAIATAAVAGVTALDVLATQRTQSTFERPARRLLPSRRELGEMHLEKAITIARTPAEVYGFFRDFENLPRFMGHLESVQVLDATRSHWKTHSPIGSPVEWDAEMTEDEPDTRIAWRSLPHSDLAHEGVVRFVPAPSGRGTEVHVEMRLRPPGGPLLAAFASLFGESPEQQLYDDLRALKQILEVGEVVRSDASIHRGTYPARPAG